MMVMLGRAADCTTAARLAMYADNDGGSAPPGELLPTLLSPTTPPTGVSGDDGRTAVAMGRGAVAGVGDAAGVVWMVTLIRTAPVCGPAGAALTSAATALSSSPPPLPA